MPPLFLANKAMLSVFIDGVELVKPFVSEHFSFLETPKSRCFVGVPLPDMLSVRVHYILIL